MRETDGINVSPKSNRLSVSVSNVLLVRFTVNSELKQWRVLAVLPSLKS